MKPTLPEPDIYESVGPSYDSRIVEGYTAETVQRLIDEAYAAGLEDAALICDGVNNYSNPMTANDCADEIRSLKEGARHERQQQTNHARRISMGQSSACVQRLVDQ